MQTSVLNTVSLQSSLTNLKIGKSEKDTIGKLYRNITGPGQYEQHQMTGKFVVDSRKSNQPSFSFGLKQDFYDRKPPIISKEHRVDYYARDSPGAGTYSPDLSHKKFNQSTVHWSIPKERRFNGPPVEVNASTKK